MDEKRKKIANILWTVGRGLLTAGVFALGFYLLWRYDYIRQFAAVDNFVGMLPILLVIVGCTAFTVALWLKHTKKLVAPLVCLAVISVLSFSLFPNALVGNWWIDYGQPQTTESEPELDVYAPFAENNALATVDFPEAEKLTADLPQLDGAVALYPVYAAIAQAFYAKDAFEREGGCAQNTYENNGERVIMTNTLRAYNGLIDGERDVIFVAGASESQRKKARDAGVELVFTPIGKEAFVFIVANDNPTDGLTYQQIKNVYSGKTAMWRTLGWKEGGRIVDFRRPDGSGSQTALQNIMRGTPLTVPQPLPSRDLAGSNSLMTQMTVEYNGVRPALGYSYKYFATRMYPNPDTKLLAINGIAPTAENIASGAYPFTVEFYAVTVGTPTSNTEKLINMILSESGQKLIEQTGYAPLH